MNISVFLIFLFFFFLFFSMLIVPFFKFGAYFFVWDFLSLKFNFFFSSLSFSFVLLLVTLSVVVFSSYYLNGELNFSYYYFVFVVFVFSMFFLIFSSSVFTILLMWDLLGISSFFLVLFYNNWDSCSGSMNTALTNRLGDFFLFVFFSGSVFSSFYFLSLSLFVGLGFLFLILASFTKSAQFPFSSWLPKAMSAPTPVSSLVHSSTLVTAGLVLLMNFNFCLLSSGLSGMLFFVGIFTMFFSSVSALLEEDLKKVVALSTLSQMGFSVMTFGMGLIFVSYLHLLSHALFKSCLFMQVGYLIHCSFGQQDGRGYSGLGALPKFIQVQLLVTLFCLCGLFFSSGSVSKDFILEFFFSNFYFAVLSFMFFVSVLFTFYYSYRLWKSFFLSFSSSLLNYSSGILMNYLSIFLVVGSICFIWWMNVNLLDLPNLYLYVDFFVPLFYVVLLFGGIYFGYSFFFKEFMYKFLSDYLSLVLVSSNKNLKFFDLFLNSLNSKGVTFFCLSNFPSLGFMKGSVNFLVLILFLIFLMF